MLMTPPDIFSQLMLAIPVWVLFELGLYVSKSIKPQTRAQADAASVEDEALDREMEAGIAEFDRLDDDDPSSRS
jgi:sec-independent protein translocase protein TatC